MNPPELKRMLFGALISPVCKLYKVLFICRWSYTYSVAKANQLADFNADLIDFTVTILMTIKDVEIIIEL